MLCCKNACPLLFNKSRDSECMKWADLVRGCLTYDEIFSTNYEVPRAKTWRANAVRWEDDAGHIFHVNKSIVN